MLTSQNQKLTFHYVLTSGCKDKLRLSWWLNLPTLILMKIKNADMGLKQSKFRVKNIQIKQRQS